MNCKTDPFNILFYIQICKPDYFNLISFFQKFSPNLIVPLFFFLIVLRTVKFHT